MMRTMGKLAMGILAGLVLTTGCDSADEQQFLDSQEPLPNEVIRAVVDGEELVTYRFVKENGLTLNGLTLNGITLNGPSFTDWLLNDLPDIVNLQIDENGELSVTKPNGKVKVSTSDKIRVRFKLDETTYQLKISELENGSDGLQFMRVQWRMLGESEWQKACVDGDGNEHKAVLITGAYDPATGDRTNNPDEAMWACRGTSAAKASELGYDENDPRHEALVRLFRADYCGVGEPNTETGTPIDLASNDGALSFDTEWATEAAWNESGAICLNDPRKLFVDKSALGCELPACTDALLAGEDALFVTRANPT